MSLGNYSLLVSAKTWTRDSHGLFDYESEHVAKNIFEIRSPGALLRQENNLQFTPSLVTGPSVLLTLNAQSAEGQFTLKLQNEDTAIWTVVRFLGERKSMRLDCGQIVKLGRVMYRVKEIENRTTGEVVEVCSDTASSEEEPVKDDDPTTSDETLCRICYEKQRSRDNPLLSPCRCDGTVKYLHLNCLKQWVKSKITTRQTENSVTYQWKTIECDICKLELPLTLKTKTAQVNLIEHDRPHTPFIVLEAYPSERASSKSLHVIMMTSGKQSIRLGRGHDSDVRINDISVSRLHALINFDGEQFLIEDKESKFGTLVRSDDVVLTPTQALTVQVGRSLLECRVQQASAALGSNPFRHVTVDESLE